MSFNSIDEILAANDELLQRFLSEVSGLSEGQEVFRPSEGSWSIAEIVEHVALVNNNFLRIVGRLHQQALADGAGPAGPILIGPLLEAVDPERQRKVEAPERVRPRGDQPVTASLHLLRQTASGFREIQPQLEAVDLSGPTIPHALGQLNAYQWLVLLGEHQERHLAQITQLRAAPGYPV